MQQDPDDLINDDVVKDMGAVDDWQPDDYNSAEMAFENMPLEQAQAQWDSLTTGTDGKLNACVKNVGGKVEDPKAYCNALSKRVGYGQE